MVLGANGFLGRYLCRHLARQGREVVAVSRRRDGWGGDGIWLPWDGATAGPWALALEGAEAVINLAGRSVNCRYTAANRQAILESRVASTRLVGAAVAGCRVPPRVWLNASTATIYRDARDLAMHEWHGEPGAGFSVGVARAWEDALFGCRVPGVVRKVALRLGMVLAEEPGTVCEVLGRLAGGGFGGAMGGGGQRVAWLHMDDFLAAVDWLIEHREIDGPVNVCAPQAPTNRELMRALRAVHGTPFGLPVPRWLLAAGAWLLRTESELVLKSRWVEPARLLEGGFSFAFPEVLPALADLAGRPGLDGFFARPAPASHALAGMAPLPEH